MTLQKGFTNELKSAAAVPKIGIAASELLDSSLTKLGQHVDVPLRLFASDTPDAVLNIGSNQVTAGDGAIKSLPPSDDTLTVYAGATINFQTGTLGGGTLHRNGSTFTVPTASGAGKFIRLVFSYKALSNAVDSNASGEYASYAALLADAVVNGLADPGTLFASIEGTPVGYIDLESTSTTAWKTVAAGTSIIENGKIFRFGSGSGSGAGAIKDFKIQAVATPSATIKGGFIGLDDGNELATYDGAGTAPTDFGKDLTINLTTVLGSAPADATNYYLYVDLNSLSSAVTMDNGRKVKAVQQANFYLSTTNPDQINRARYVHIGFIRSATTGNAWSGTGSYFGTYAIRKHNNGPIAVNPKVYSLSQVVGAVGSVGQVAAGHVIDANSFPSALAAGSRLWYSLEANGNDGSGNAKNLTNNGAIPFTGVDLWGVSNKAAVLDGSTQYFSSVDTAFNAGLFSFAFGAWFNSSDWTPSSYKALFSNDSATPGSRGYLFYVDTDGSIKIQISPDGTALSNFSIANPGLVDGTWHHLAVIYNHASSILKVFIDGKLCLSSTFTKTSAPAVNLFQMGGVSSGAAANRFAGRVREAFFVTNYLLNDDDLRRLYSYRFDHNKNVLAKNQDWKVILSTPCSIPNWQPIVCQANVNSLYADFSDLASTDTVDLALLDMGMSPAIVPAVPPFDQTYTSNPTFPLTHGQAEVPRLIVMAKDASNDWHTMDAAGLIKADSTQIKGSIQSLFDASYTAVRIIGFVGNSPTGVKEAESGTPGILAYANQEKFIAKTSAYNVVKGDKILADTSGGAFTLTLPPSPSIGDHAEFYDAAGTWGSNNLTIGRNGSNIQGSATDLVANISGDKLKLIYVGATPGWRVF